MTLSVPELLPPRGQHPPDGGPKRFAVVGVRRTPGLERALEARRTLVGDAIARSRKAIDANVATFVSWFEGRGHRCPLPRQLARTVERGLPSVSGPVDSLMYCEMTTGVLMGVQDLAAVLGPVHFDFADAGERFEGFRGPVACSEGEPVVRDGGGIIASVFQGPDRRTSVTPGSRELLFYVFDSPALSGEAFQSALDTLLTLMREAEGDPRERCVELR